VSARRQVAPTSRAPRPPCNPRPRPRRRRLELEDAPSRGRASAARLHSAASFAARAGHAPAALPAVLALAGKRAAGVAGTGLSERAARRLVQRCGAGGGKEGKALLLSSHTMSHPAHAVHPQLD
jgi:hypothetical protein